MQKSDNKASSLDSKAMKDVVAAMPYQDLLQRKEEIQGRLKVITIEPIKAKKPSNSSGQCSKSRKGNSRSAAKSSKATKEDNDNC